MCCPYCCGMVTCGSPGLSWFIRDRISTCSGTRGTTPAMNSFISPQRCSTLRAACSCISASSSGDRWFFFSRSNNNNSGSSSVVRAVITITVISVMRAGGCCMRRAAEIKYEKWLWCSFRAARWNNMMLYCILWFIYRCTIMHCLLWLQSKHCFT